MMDDANVPSLLALPYLEAVNVNDEVYQRTRKYILSADNPFFFKGKAGEGIGGPHIGRDYIWPIAITMRGLTSNNDAEIRECIQMLVKHMAEQDSCMNLSIKMILRTSHVNGLRANTLFGEFIWKTYNEKPHLLG